MCFVFANVGTGKKGIVTYKDKVKGLVYSTKGLTLGRLFRYMLMDENVSKLDK